MHDTILVTLLVISLPCVVALLLWAMNWSPKNIVGASLCILVLWSGKVWHGMHDVRAAETTEPCNMVVSGERYARAFRRLSDLKEICGHMEDPEQHLACIQNPMLPQLNSSSCVVTENTAKELHGWIGARAPDLYLACSQQGPCMRWAETAKSWDGSPILE